MNYIDAFNWRYAAKHMKDRVVEQAKVDRICEAARLAPSSFGLQPYALLQLHDREQRREIFVGPAPQPQIAECSHLLVLATRTNIDHALVDRFIRLTANARGQSIGDLHGYSQAIKGTLDGFESSQAIQEWARSQAYIALGFILASAAMEQVDATPMEGFDPAALDELLGLGDRGLHSVALVALGYRDEVRDRLASAGKVRWPRGYFMPQFDLVDGASSAACSRDYAEKIG